MLYHDFMLADVKPLAGLELGTGDGQEGTAVQ